MENGKYRPISRPRNTERDSDITLNNLHQDFMGLGSRFWLKCWFPWKYTSLRSQTQYFYPLLNLLQVNEYNNFFRDLRKPLIFFFFFFFTNTSFIVITFALSFHPFTIQPIIGNRQKLSIEIQPRLVIRSSVHVRHAL